MRGVRKCIFCPRSVYKNCPSKGWVKMAKFCPRSYWMTPCNKLTLTLWIWVIWKSNLWFHCFNNFITNWTKLEFSSEFSFCIIYSWFSICHLELCKQKPPLWIKLVSHQRLFLLLLIEMKLFRFNECKQDCCVMCRCYLWRTIQIRNLCAQNN